MKTKVMFFFCFVSLQSLVAQKYIHTQPLTEVASTHGMMLMGTDKIYASHLPMFHSPHDYQIILVLEFAEQDKQRYLNNKISNPQENIYTLEPELFVLPEMVNETKIFKGNLFRGHFERGGTKILENIVVKIKKVIYFNKFQKDINKPLQMQYILFGNLKEQFLAHQIFKKPDFDENIAVSINDNKTLELLNKNSYCLISFEEKENRQPFLWKTEMGTVKGTHQKINFLNHKTLYLEFKDLD
jgi:hypothetical protein